MAPEAGLTKVDAALETLDELLSTVPSKALDKSGYKPVTKVRGDQVMCQRRM